MKTIKEIEKAAVDYVQTLPFGEYFHDLDIERAFIAGAKSELEELTRWRDPKVELPDTDVEVLVMVHADGHTYDVMRYDKCGWWQKAPGGGWCAPNNAPIGWRYIHEL